MIGKVIKSNIKGKSMVQAGDRLYILNLIGVHKGQEVVFDDATAIKVPSLLFGLALLKELDLAKTVEFVKKNW